MKRFPLVFLATVSIAFAIGSCSQKSGGATTGGAKKYTNLPFVTDGKTTFTAYVSDGGINAVTSYAVEDNLFTQKIVRETGINLDLITSTSGTDQLSIMLNSGNYPDLVIKGLGIGYDSLVYYANQGIFRPLDEYDPLSYPRIKAAFDEYPALDQFLRGSDGKLYALPGVNECWHCQFAGGRIWYYMPWIRDNNLKVPQTLDEFTEYLRYVKTHDLNKNGRQDEIPAAFYAGEMLNFVSAIAKAFLPMTYSGYHDGVAVENGKLVEQYRDPRFRDALKYLAGLYSEGLILPDSFTMSGDEFKTLAESPDPVLAVEGMTWLFWSTTHPSVRSSEKFVLPPLEGPQGQRNGSNISPFSVFYHSFIVTDKCKDPALAVALYDYLIDFENELDGYLGPKGQAWVEPEPGVLSIMGTQATHENLWSFGNVPAVNASWGQANPMIRNNQFRNGETAEGIEIIRQWYETGDPSLQEQVVALPAFAGEGMWYTVTERNAQYAMPNSLFVPPMALSDEDDARITDINVMLDSYKQQAIAEFITGIRNINSDAEWNTYLADLDRLGSAEMVQIRQKYIR